MIKTDLISAVSEETGYSAVCVSKVLESVLNAIRHEVKNGNDVVLRNFGTFKLKHKAERHARDISRGKLMIIPAKDAPAFKPSKQFCDVD